MPKDNDDHTCTCTSILKKVKSIFWSEKVTLALLIALIVYLFVGAGVLNYIERENELQANRAIYKFNASYTQYRDLVVEWLVDNTNLTIEVADGLITNVTRDAISASVDRTNNWSFGGSLFFMLILCTTIGESYCI